MSEPTVFESFDGLKAYVGREIGSSDWITITQEKINAFADATGDHQWIHVDEERARRESPFKQTIAHGYLILSLIPVLFDQVGRMPYRTAINSGFDKVRLRGPVPAGARVRMHASLKTARDLPGGGLRAVFSLTFEVEGRRKPACVAEGIYLYYP